MKFTKLLKTFLIAIILVCLVTTSIPMTFAASPKIASIQVNDLEIIEGTNGWYDKEYDYDADEYVEWYKYDYDFSVEYTVTLTDGTVLKSDHGWVEYNGKSYSLYYTDDQSYKTAWGVGAHEVTAELLGCETTFNITIVESPIESITANDVEVVEHTYGDYVSYIDDNGSEYVYYEYYPSTEFTITMKDGTVLESQDGSVTINGEEFWVDYSTDQSYDNEWAIGTHTVNVILMGIETSFKYTIAESPVSSIKFNDINIIEGSNLLNVSEYDYDTDEYVEWLKYDYDHFINFIVTLKDGTVIKSDNGSVEYNGKYYRLEYTDDQSYENQWNVGTHKVAAEILGCKTTFNVTITESPVKSIEIKNADIYQDIDGYISNSYNPETDEYDLEWFNYSYSDLIDCTITLKDGTVINDTYYEDEFNDETYSISFYDDQSYENQWGIGAHTVEARLLGCITTFEVNVLKNPVVSVVFSDVEQIENAGGYYVDYYDDESEEVLDEWYRYDYATPKCTITLNDGTIITNSEEDPNCVLFNGKEYYISLYDDQSYENQWKLGTYTAEGKIFGKTAKFNVNIVETPVSKVEIKDLERIVDTGFTELTEDGKEWQRYVYSFFGFDITITLKDGTVLTNDGGYANVSYKGKNYSFDYIDDDQSYENQWGLGAHKVNASIMGFETSFNVNIIESPVSSIEIDNKNIVLTEDDGEWYYDTDPVTGEEISWFGYDYYANIINVTLNDGKVLKVNPQTGSVSYKGQLYFTKSFDDQSYDNQWGVGTHTAYVSIMGATVPVNITILPSSSESIFGDANGDGEVNITDATEIQKHCAGLLEISSERMGLCDINLDGEINVLDATELQKYLTDLIKSDIIGKPYNN